MRQKCCGLLNGLRAFLAIPEQRRYSQRWPAGGLSRMKANESRSLSAVKFRGPKSPEVKRALGTWSYLLACKRISTPLIHQRINNLGAKACLFHCFWKCMRMLYLQSLGGFAGVTKLKPDKMYQSLEKCRWLSQQYFPVCFFRKRLNAASEQWSGTAENAPGH